MGGIGEEIKKIRLQKKIPVEQIAKKLGVSKTTIYRYEDSTIEKIPMKIFEGLCQILEVTPAQLTGSASIQYESEMRQPFHNAKEAIEFVLKLPVVAEYAGYQTESMSDEAIEKFAEEMLKQLEFITYKYQAEKNS